MLINLMQHLKPTSAQSAQNNIYEARFLCKTRCHLLTHSKIRALQKCHLHINAISHDFQGTRAQIKHLSINVYTMRAVWLLLFVAFLLFSVDSGQCIWWHPLMFTLPVMQL